MLLSMGNVPSAGQPLASRLAAYWNAAVGRTMVARECGGIKHAEGDGRRCEQCLDTRYTDVMI